MELLIGTEAGVFDLRGERLLDGVNVHHIAHRSGSWWAVSDNGVFRDGQEIAPSPAGVAFNCLEPTPDEIWLGANSARLFRLVGDEISEDEFFAEAPGRDKWHTPWGGPPDVRSMSYGPDGTLYINVHVGGILRYDNTGLDPTLDIDSDVHQVVAHPSQEGRVVAATAFGLAQSSNGHDFEFRTEGLDHRYCRAVALDGETVLVSASQGHQGGHSRLYRGSFSGGGLEACTRGLPAYFTGNLDTHCVVTRDNAYYAGNGQTVWVSTDGGDTWEVAATDLPGVTCLA